MLFCDVMFVVCVVISNGCYFRYIMRAQTKSQLVISGRVTIIEISTHYFKGVL